MLRYAMLRYAMLRYAMLCCAVLCCALGMLNNLFSFFLLSSPPTKAPITNIGYISPSSFPPPSHQGAHYCKGSDGESYDSSYDR